MKNTTLTTLAKTARYALEKTEDITEKEFTGKYYEGSSQEEIPIKDIRNGLVITNDNRYVGMVEVFPINFEHKTVEEKRRILDSFNNVFQMQWYKFSIKVMSDYTDVKDMVENVVSNSHHLTNDFSRECLNDYINYIYKIGSTKAIVRRYFIFWEYSGEDGVKAKDFGSIVKTMDEQRHNLIKTLQDCGNSCMEFKMDAGNFKYNEFVCEVIYKFFNRKSSLTESFLQRKARIDADFKRFNDLHGTNKSPAMADYLAPKGLYFLNRDFMCEDGMYYTFIGLDGHKFPDSVVGGEFTDYIATGAYVDVDYIFKINPKNVVLPLLKFFNSNTERGVREKLYNGKEDKGRLLFNKLKNNSYVYESLNGDCELYNMSVIVTIRTPSYELLKNIVSDLKDHYKRKLGVSIIEATDICEDFWRQTMPCLYTTKLFNKMAHNILSNAITSLYPFTTYQLYDIKGCVLGVNDNGTIVSPNVFDTSMFINANMTIIGSSGAGKTFTEELIGRRMYLNGCRAFFIIPKKAVEDYYEGCKNIGGTFISLMQGSEDRINVLDIRPEGKALNIDGVNSKKLSGSWMTHKIVNVCAWISLIMHGERMTTTETNALQKALINTYAKKGITSDNASIYEDINTGTLKEMPILGDLYDEIKDNPSLKNIKDALEPFVHGIASNMNGHTNVDIENARYVVFDIDEDKISAELFSSFLYLAFDYIYNMVKENVTSKDIIVLDEVWKMMVIPDSAKQVSRMVKLVRSYGGSVISATQQMGDFEKAGEMGMDVLNNAEINLYLAMKPQDIESTTRLMNLKPDTVKEIEKLKKTYGLLVTRTEKIKIHIEATDMELETMSTDINDRIEKEANKVAQEERKVS